MDVLALRQTKRDLAGWLFYGIRHGDLDPPLEFANILGIRVEPGLITRTKVLLEKRQFMRYRIQDAGVLFSSSSSFLGACAIAEKALESHTRIDLCRKRLRRRGP